MRSSSSLARYASQHARFLTDILPIYYWAQYLIFYHTYRIAYYICTLKNYVCFSGKINGYVLGPKGEFQSCELQTRLGDWNPPVCNKPP